MKIKFNITYKQGGKIKSFPTLNEYIYLERANKYIAANIKKKCTQIIAEESIQYKKLFKKLKFPAKFIFTWYVKNKKKDFDNISFIKKYILDGLVIARCLKNDGQKYFNWDENKIAYTETDQEFVEIEIISPHE